VAVDECLATHQAARTATATDAPETADIR
jgi:hypothetical protein